MSLSLIGLILGLVLLIVLTIRGMNLMVAGPLCALIVALTSGVPIFTSDIETTPLRQSRQRPRKTQERA